MPGLIFGEDVGVNGRHVVWALFGSRLGYYSVRLAFPAILQDAEPILMTDLLQALVVVSPVS